VLSSTSRRISILLRGSRCEILRLCSEMTPEGFLALRNTLSTARSWVRVVAFVALALQLWASVALSAAHQIGRDHRHDRFGYRTRETEFFSNVLALLRRSAISKCMARSMKNCRASSVCRMRVVRMKLGEETIELTQYLAPEGRSIPADWRQQRPGVSAYRDRRCRYG
jgi:hypothetical protein